MAANKLHIIFAAVAALIAAFGVRAQDKSFSMPTPEIHGVVIGRWEGEFHSDDNDFANRFNIRHARVSVNGSIVPSLTYKVQVDVCDRGKFVFLDAFGRWAFARNRFAVKAGQFRVPFGVDCFTAPGKHLFSDRSFLHKNVVNLRQVGIQLGYYGTDVPLTAEAGFFNSAPKESQAKWQTVMDFAAKVVYRTGPLAWSASFLSERPSQVRMNTIDVNVTWKIPSWEAQAEYQRKHYAGNAFTPTNAWLAFVSYNRPVSWGTFNNIGAQCRFDGITDLSNGTTNDEGILTATEGRRNRITVGPTLSHLQKHYRVQLRLNYEKYFYPRHAAVPEGLSDKIVAEMAILF